MRPGEDETQTLEAAKLWRKKGAVIDFLRARQMDISSTEIRRRIGAGEPLDGLLCAGVEDYIRAHGLYGTDGSKPDETR